MTIAIIALWAKGEVWVWQKMTVVWEKLQTSLKELQTSSELILTHCDDTSGASLRWCDWYAVHQGYMSHVGDTLREYHAPSVCHPCQGCTTLLKPELSPDGGTGCCSLRGALQRSCAWANFPTPYQCSYVTRVCAKSGGGSPKGLLQVRKHFFPCLWVSLCAWIGLLRSAPLTTLVYAHFCLLPTQFSLPTPCTQCWSSIASCWCVTTAADHLWQHSGWAE